VRSSATAGAESLWLNGGLAAWIDPAGEFNTAVSLAIEDGRVTRIYAVRNPHKLTRLVEETALSR
jgi:RNA polymerase sigma-70 factor (ECF subfamily)